MLALNLSKGSLLVSSLFTSRIILKGSLFLRSKQEQVKLKASTTGPARIILKGSLFLRSEQQQAGTKVPTTALICFLSLLCCQYAFPQTVLTEQQVVENALQQLPQLKVAQLKVQQQEVGQYKGIGLSNPDVYFEDTPEGFSLLGVEQTFGLPGAYRSEKQLQAAELALTKFELVRTKAEMRRWVRNNYLQWQYAQAKLTLLQQQDSLFNRLNNTAQRAFAGGEINALEQQFTQLQADQTRQQVRQAQSEWLQYQRLMQTLTGLKDSIVAEPLDEMLSFDYSTWLLNASVDSSIVIGSQHVKLNEQVQQAALQVAKTEGQPTFLLGYEHRVIGTSEQPYGFRTGISVPLWRGRYGANIRAAEQAVEVAKAQTTVQYHQRRLQANQLLAEIKRYQQSLAFYQNTTRPQIETMIRTSERLFAGGETDYIAHLRNLTTIFEWQHDYLETLKDIHQALLDLQFLGP